MHIYIFLLLVITTTFVASELATTGVKLRTSCCACEQFGLPCPFCTYQATNVCSMPNGSDLNRWVRYVTEAYFSVGLPSNPFSTPWVNKSTTRIAYLSADPSYNYVLMAAWRYPCSSLPRNVINYFGSITYHCNSFSDQCSDPDSHCRYYEANPISNPNSLYPYYCSFRDYYKPGKYYIDSKSPNTLLCNPYTSTSFGSAKIINFIKSLTEDPPYPNKFTQTSTTITFSTTESRFLLPLTDLLADDVPVNPVLQTTSALLHVHCTNDSNVAALLGGLSWGYWLNVAVRIRPTPCDSYIPYDDKYDICVYDLLAPAGTPYCQDTFRLLTETWTEFVVEQPIPLKNSTEGCYACMDYLVDKLPSSTGNLSNFAAEQNQYARQRQAETFSWWENIIGGVLTAPLFNRFRNMLFEVIDYLLIEFLKIVGDILLNLLNTVYELLKSSQPFIDMLIDYITKILDVLFSLVSLVLKIVIGLLIQADQHFLIFEYLLLFLWLNYKFLNNNLFCMIVVILVAVVFGVERNHPSLLLTFYNLQYSYVNFSFYNSASFTYKYTLNYHNRLNSSSSNLTIGFTPIGEIPHYNLTSKPPSLNFTKFDTTTNVTTCDSFPYYNTSTKLGYYVT